MPSNRAIGALAHILHNIALAHSFVRDMGYEDFRADTRTVYAVTRCLEIISEASRRLPNDLKQRHPQIPWADIAAAGNIYRHDYEDVLEQFLWRTVETGLEALLAVVEQELQNLNGS